MNILMSVASSEITASTITLTLLFWDDYRNKLVLIGMISPDVTTDIIRSIIDKGEKRDGYMPTFFHGDHASTFFWFLVAWFA